jgi:glutathione synthase/RimK-type ligase-like ATP-grasp enzyme
MWNEDMILIISAIDDPVMRHFRTWLNEHHHDDYVQLTQEELGATWEINWVGNDIRFISKQHGIDLGTDNIGGIYARLAGLPLEDKSNKFVKYQILESALNCIDTRVVNRPSSMSYSISKPYQHKKLLEYGLEPPSTCITNSPIILSRFNSRLNNNVIYKSISSCRSIVRRLDLANERQLAYLQYCPVQFQELERGDNIRVHVLGDETLSVKIKSGATDYRYSKAQGHQAIFEIIDLPAHLKKKCIELTRAVGLAFSGIDLLEGENNSYRCFEINPQPGYSSFERNSGIPISAALYDYLSRN